MLSVRFEAELCDFYYNTTPGNSGTPFWHYRADPDSVNGGIAKCDLDIDRITGADIGVAVNPTPLDCEPAVLTSPTLTWVSAYGCDAHEVYLGTSKTAVTNATTASPEYKGSFSTPSYTPSSLSLVTTYYWRVDEVYGANRYPGKVWSFKTVSSVPATDTTAPTPNPATFAVAPYANGNMITMTATTGSDVSGPVEYYFHETSGNRGGTDSGWQQSPTWTDMGLIAGTQYTYTVQMRDALGNATAISSLLGNISWNIIADSKNKVVYFRTSRNMEIKSVSIAGWDFSPASKMKCMDIDYPQKGDLTGKLVDWTPEINAGFVAKVYPGSTPSDASWRGKLDLYCRKFLAGNETTPAQNSTPVTTPAASPGSVPRKE